MLPFCRYWTKVINFLTLQRCYVIKTDLSFLPLYFDSWSQAIAVADVEWRNSGHSHVERIRILVIFFKRWNSRRIILPVPFLVVSLLLLHDFKRTDYNPVPNQTTKWSIILLLFLCSGWHQHRHWHQRKLHKDRHQEWPGIVCYENGP